MQIGGKNIKSTWENRVDDIIHTGVDTGPDGYDVFETMHLCETVAIYRIRPDWFETE